MKRCRIVLLYLVMVAPIASFSLPQEKVYWDVVERIRDEGFNRSRVA